jgi:hypothetical protein
MNENLMEYFIISGKKAVPTHCAYSKDAKYIVAGVQVASVINTFLLLSFISQISHSVWPDPF